MTEVRMRSRQKGSQFQEREIANLLYAYGDDREPLKATVDTLDEIIVDFIIETAHEAALVAQTSHRAKIKVDDFKFAIRKDPKKLGRVSEMLNMDREIKLQKKIFNTDPEEGKDAVAEGMELDEEGVDAEGKRKGKGRGGKGGKRGKRKRAEEKE